MEILFIILVILLGPAIMFAIGANLLAKSAETMNEIRRMKRK